MEQQNYANHKRYDSKYHFIMIALVLIVLVCTIINLVQAFSKNVNPLSAIVLLLISIMFTLLLGIIRPYPLKAQDRAILAEEGLRYFILTGQRLDPNLTRSQIFALRFASDAELPALSERAVSEKLTNDAIKKAIVSWRADHFRI
jgi:hypothetical protein